MSPKKVDPELKDDFWRTYIEDTPLNDNTWSVQVVMIEAAGSDQDRIYLNKFEVFAAEEKRFVIKNICKSETMFMINQLGGDKKSKDESLRVFEEGQAYLKDKKDIPPDIQALIVKHLILKMKEEYLHIQKQQLQVREGMRRESATMIDRTEVRGTVSVARTEPPELSLPPQIKGKKGEVEPAIPADEPEEGRKYNTSLRVRGEEWRDKVYVDDFPLDGPNLYVAVTGFMEPQLAGCLIKIGVPVTAIFQIRIDLSVQHIPASLTRPTKRGQSQTDVLIEKSLGFWQELQQLRINKETSNDYNNTAFVVFTPPYWSADNLSGNADKIYDELCFLMYDIQDLTRQRSNYLENMDIINIPTKPENPCYERYYHQNVDDIALESCTMYSVLDSILEAVCINHDLSNDTSRTTLSAALPFNQTHPFDENKVTRAETLISNVFDALNATDENKKSYRLTYGEEWESHKDPVVIHFGDFVKYQTFHLKNVHLDEVVFSMLLGMPINQLWLNQEREKDEIEAKINFHVSVLLSCFNRSDLETAELNRLLHILACRKLYSNRSSLKKTHISPISISEFKKVYLKRTVLAEPLPRGITPLIDSSNTTNSFPSMTKVENTSSLTNSSSSSEERRLRFLFDCPDISELVSAAEIISNAPNEHVIDDFDFFEDFSETRAFQVLREAFNNFNCVDYKYCEVTDTCNLMFFNSHDHDGIAREEWRSHLATPVCLQDFFDFVLKEHFDWIQNEEHLYDQKLCQDSASQCAAEDLQAQQSCIEKQDLEMELLIEGSLKFQETVEVDDSNQLTSPSSQEEIRASTRESTAVDSKSTKKTKTSVAASSLNSLGDSEADINIPVKPFQGYDLGERRVEVFGKDDAFYSKDGTRVFSRYSCMIPMNFENITLNVVPGNGSNEFWLHKSFGDDITPDMLDACGSFRITSKDEVIINIKKEVYNVPIPTVTSSLYDQDMTKAKKTVPNSVPSQEELPIFESKTYHSLCVTWPNGLITETVYDENSATLSHIKQYYVVPPHNEEMRCISLNGEVIIFQKSGNIEVLRSDGTYIKITKYAKRIREPSLKETKSVSVEQTSGTNKNKKDTHGPHGKEKPSKLSSKTSKNSALQHEIVSSSGTREYEMFFDEFEIIETSGLRQQWVGDCAYDIENLLIRTATDYCLGEVFSRRMDGTQVLLKNDGVQIVTFPNNTRIITRFIIEDEEIYPEWTEDELCYFELLESGYNSVRSKQSVSRKNSLSSKDSFHSSANKRYEEEEPKKNIRADGYVSVQINFTIEHANFTSVTLNKADGKVTVDSPNNTSVIVDTSNHYEIKLDSATVATFDGENLKIDYVACFECQSRTTCQIKIRQDEMNPEIQIRQRWLYMEDSFGKKIAVNNEGAINLLKDPVQSPASTMLDTEVEIAPENQESSVIAHAKCKDMCNAKQMRFFVLRRDLTCSELVHRALVERYMKTCRFQPWCSINDYDTFGDNRGLLSILTPVSQTESEKWIMETKFSDKPKKMTYKDLKKDPGKGFYHWMRPYRRFHPRPPVDKTPELPRAFILRILERQWKERDRNQLKGGRELLRAVLKYRRVMESDCEEYTHVPIIDQRLESELRVDELIQALGHRVYEELKTKLDVSVATRARPDITTKPEPQRYEYLSEEMEAEEEVIDPEKILKANRGSLVQEAQVDEMSPNLKSYWRRREEEFKEEKFYLHLLREGIVPPYFRNVLGGAIWWDVDNAAASAVGIAERRKMKCVCNEGEMPGDEEPYM